MTLMKIIVAFVLNPPLFGVMPVANTSVKGVGRTT